MGQKTLVTVYHRLGQLRDTVYGNIMTVLSLHKLHYTKLSFYHSILSMKDWIITAQMTNYNAVAILCFLIFYSFSIPWVTENQSFSCLIKTATYTMHLTIPFLTFN